MTNERYYMVLEDFIMYNPHYDLTTPIKFHAGSHIVCNGGEIEERLLNQGLIQPQVYFEENGKKFFYTSGNTYDFRNISVTKEDRKSIVNALLCWFDIADEKKEDKKKSVKATIDKAKIIDIANKVVDDLVKEISSILRECDK